MPTREPWRSGTVVNGPRRVPPRPTLTRTDRAARKAAQIDADVAALELRRATDPTPGVRAAVDRELAFQRSRRLALEAAQKMNPERLRAAYEAAAHGLGAARIAALDAGDPARTDIEREEFAAYVILRQLCEVEP